MTPWQKREGWSLESKYFVTECSGGSRGGALGARLPPPLIFRPKWSPRIIILGDHPPPPPLM